MRFASVDVLSPVPSGLTLANPMQALAKLSGRTTDPSYLAIHPRGLFRFL